MPGCQDARENHRAKIKHLKQQPKIKVARSWYEHDTGFVYAKALQNEAGN